MNLDSPIADLSRIGKVTAKRFQKLGLENVQDLLFYYPFRYDDFSQIFTIDALKPNQTATIKGKIELITNKRSPVKRKIITEAIVADGTGSIKIIWFNQPFLVRVLKAGDEVYFSGKVDYDYHGLQFTNPSYEKDYDWMEETTNTARLVPVYPATERLTQKQIRYVVKAALDLADLVKDWLPEEIKKELKLVNLTAALRQIHFPDSQEELKQARHRLKFNELFLIQLRNQNLKKELQKYSAPPIGLKLEETKKLISALPFKLTNAQRKAAWEILKDTEKDKPMNRLLDGDVGSGKTLVAAIAMLNAALNGYQTVLMAPTEILARQHYETFSRLLKDFPVTIGLLTRTEAIKIKNSKLKIKNYSSKVKNKNEILKEITSEKINIIIGTHALIQEGVKLNNLGLVVVDEQHRFGVEQRAQLIKNSTAKAGQAGQAKLKITNYSPHFLSMTATPIPRSLALTVYGDLDLSVIDEMPKNRKKILTKIVSPQNRPKAYEFIRQQIKNGRQAFVICPLIDESDKLGVKSAKKEHKKLTETIFPDLKIGLLHGRLKPAEKEAAMRDFLAGKINILVSTSVVEVGVDAPNAAVMVIEGAERFGLAQLYQFRGRVGRSVYQSYCFLFTESENLKTRRRLEALLTAKNGFELAEKDLAIRGPGEVFGGRQSGFVSELKIARLTDYAIIAEAQKQAEKILTPDAELAGYPLLRRKIAVYDGNIHLE